jgi:methyl-accepting chemotaxis protein
MHWFQAVAPIRQKLLVASNALLAVMTLSTLVALIAPTLVALPIVAVLILGTAIQCARYRKAIADPYVATVVRMEALAAGDLASPIQFTDYQDCVGRMTKAMLNFRDAAIAQQRLAQEQDEAVQRLGSQLERLSQGDLTAEIGEGFPTGYALLRTNYNAALASLRGLIGSVTESASTIHTGSGEIAQASEDLARRTEANAASLQQTAAAVTQMDQRLKATAAAANRTVGRADGAIATVSGGRAIADEAVQAMTRVADSAKGIDSVIEGLDKIAFQTRVLAMNAAVEAGRAGEAGRGFAVVADLVSALAMRAEEEAGRARDQLTATQTDIVAAVEMVQKVDGALADISGDVGEVHSLLGEIATDNQAQSTAITQISVAIGTMDQATQQNAAMVEQTSAAARNLSGEVAALGEQAAKFEIGSEGRPMRASTPARPAKVANRSAGYVSPVKALPVTAMAGSDTWASF